MQVFGEAIAAALRGDASDTSSIASMQPAERKKQQDAAFDQPARQGGGPPRKQQQQEEVLAPLDEEERQALRRRLANRGGSGTYATSRPGVKTTSAYGPMGYGIGSARHGPEASPSGFMSPSRQRRQVQTARREQEVRTAREQQRASRERARRAALHAAQLQQAHEEEEERQRQKAREELAARRQQQQERAALVAAQSARRVAPVPTFGNNIRRAMPPPPTEKALLKKKRQARPEWGTGHAGGYKMKTTTRAVSAPHARERAQSAWGVESADMLPGAAPQSLPATAAAPPAWC